MATGVRPRGRERVVVERATTRPSGGGEVGRSLDPPVINRCRSDCAGEVLTRSVPPHPPPHARGGKGACAPRCATQRRTLNAPDRPDARRLAIAGPTLLLHRVERRDRDVLAGSRLVPRSGAPARACALQRARPGAHETRGSCLRLLQGPCKGVNHRRCTVGRAGPKPPLARQPRAASAFSPNARSREQARDSSFSATCQGAASHRRWALHGWVLAGKGHWR